MVYIIENSKVSFNLHSSFQNRYPCIIVLLNVIFAVKLEATLMQAAYCLS
jgi:hypothetical protein